MMRRNIAFSAVAALIFTAATSCKNQAQEASENQPVEEEVLIEDSSFEDAFADADEIEPVEPVEMPEDSAALTYADIEVKPKFQDGDEKDFQKWIAANVKYPYEASEERREGTVMVQFTIDTEGRITDVKILRGACPVLDSEAARVVETAPDWKPASHKGEPVEVSYVLPVKFEMKKSE